MVDEQCVADLGTRVDLDAGGHAAHIGHAMRDHRHAGLVDRVRDPVHEQRLHAAVGQEDLPSAEPTRRRVAFLRGGHVVPQLARHARQGAESEHG